MDAAVSVALATTAGAVVSGGVTLLVTRRTERTREAADTAKHGLEVAAYRLDQFDALIKAHSDDYERMRRERDEARAEVDALRHKLYGTERQ